MARNRITAYVFGVEGCGSQVRAAWTAIVAAKVDDKEIEAVDRFVQVRGFGMAVQHCQRSMCIA